MSESKRLRISNYETSCSKIGEILYVLIICTLEKEQSTCRNIYFPADPIQCSQTFTPKLHFVSSLRMWQLQVLRSHKTDFNKIVGSWSPNANCRKQKTLKCLIRALRQAVNVEPSVVNHSCIFTKLQVFGQFR